jgi:hypothetical protein
MKRVTNLRVWSLLIGLVLLAGIASSASAVTIGFPGTAPVTPTFGVPQGPPNPNIPGYNLYPFMLSQFIPPLPATPNPLPAVLFAENLLSFNLVMIAGFGPSGRIDPVVVAQTFQFFVIGDFWSVDARVAYQPASSIFSPSDVVTLTGNAVHRIAPHAGEVAPGPALPFEVVLNAGSVITLPPRFQVPAGALRNAIRDANLPVGGRFGVDFALEIHDAGPHQDFVLGLLGGQIANPNNPFVGNELEFWLGGATGLHPTPEPATLALWGVTAGGLGFLARRRRNQQTPS